MPRRSAKRKRSAKTQKSTGRRAHVNAPAQSAQESENLPEEPPAGETAEAPAQAAAADKPASERARIKRRIKPKAKTGRAKNLRSPHRRGRAKAFVHALAACKAHTPRIFRFIEGRGLSVHRNVRVFDDYNSFLRV